MKIYTKRGDDGTTSLIGGERVPKDDPRVEAYGTVDELSAFTALLRDSLPVDFADLRGELLRVLNTLMAVEASLAGGRPIADGETQWLEERIDAFALAPLKNFTLPGGHPTVSQAHICRTVCRRAERRAITAQCPDTAAQAYLNRLSDYFYSLGRALADRLGVEELVWNF